MLFRVTSAIFLFVCVDASAQTTTSDPIAEFLHRNPRYFNKQATIEELYVVLADITGDGKPEVFLSHEDMYVDRGGRTWNVYVREGGIYRQIETVRVSSSGRVREIAGRIRFRTDAFHVGPIDGTSGTELFSYSPGGGRTGVITGIWLIDNALEERKVRDMLVTHQSEDQELYNSLFVSGRGELIKAKVEDLATEAQRLALIGGTVDPSQPGGFVSRGPGEADTELENSVVSSQGANPEADVPSRQAVPDDEAEEPAATTEGAYSKEPKDSGWSTWMLQASIGAVAFLLALLGYRALKKAPSDS